MAKRILVVDDHAPTRMLIRAVLEAESGQYDVVEAASGVECLKAHAGKGPFDLILLAPRFPQGEPLTSGATPCRTWAIRLSAV